MGLHTKTVRSRIYVVSIFREGRVAMNDRGLKIRGLRDDRALQEHVEGEVNKKV